MTDRTYYDQYINPLSRLAIDIHCDNIRAGWWDGIDPNDGLVFTNKLCLIHSEISEAMEGDRKDLMDDKLLHRKMAEVELADAMIRILDLAAARDYDIGAAVAEKRAFNATRADHKRENRAAPGGKAY